MLSNKLLRTIKQYKAQFLAMLILISFGVGIFNGFIMEWSSLEKNVNRFFTEANQADYYIYSESFFSQDDEEKILESEYVFDANRSFVAEASVKEKAGDHLALVATEGLNVAGFVLMEGEQFDSMSKNGVWISDRYASANGFKLGDAITLKYDKYTLKGKVAGLIKAPEYLVCIRNDYQAMPDYEAYGYAYVSPKMLSKLSEFGCVYNRINVIAECDKTTFRKEINKLYDGECTVVAKEDTLSYEGAEQQVNEGRIISEFLPVLFFVIAILTMITTMHRITAKEKTQIGTLKALGFKNRKIILHYSQYSLLVSLVGVAFGIGIAFLIANIILNPNGTIATYIDMPYWNKSIPLYCCAIMIALIIFFAIVGAIITKKVLRGNAAQVLRPYSPKVVKRTIIDRIPIFNGLKFGSKWNIRDISRNKVRTFMSLLGVIGCTMMLVSAVGLKDSLDSYVDTFYGKAMNYSSNITLKEDTDNKVAMKLAKKYDGDYCANVSIEVDGQGASLDVYNIEDRKNGEKQILFVDNGGEYCELTDNGAYVCRRIADSLKIDKGDEVEFNLYGQNKSFRVRVAGITQSLSKNICITTKYAKQIGVDYDINTIFTQQKASPSNSKYIKTVLTKEEIVESFNSYMELIDLLILVMLITSVILGITVLYNLGIMGYTERYKDMATLKVLGFRNRAIAGLLVGQNIWITIIGIAIGIPSGYLVLYELVRKLGEEMELTVTLGWMTYVVSICATFAVSLIVAMLIARKNKEIDMVEAMKGAE